MLRVPLGLLSVMVNRVRQPHIRWEGLKLLLPAGACRLVTNMVALAAVPLCWPGLPPSLNSSLRWRGQELWWRDNHRLVASGGSRRDLHRDKAAAGICRSPRPTAAGTLPPVSTTEVPPSVAANVPPPQVLVVLPGTMYLGAGQRASYGKKRSERLTLLGAEPMLSLMISIVVRFVSLHNGRRG